MGSSNIKSESERPPLHLDERLHSSVGEAAWNDCNGRRATAYFYAMSSSYPPRAAGLVPTRLSHPSATSGFRKSGHLAARMLRSD